MATVSTTVNVIDSTTPKLSSHAKINQIKNPPNSQNTPQPLKFRSFDAFYQYYSKKQSTENSLHWNSHVPHPNHDNTLPDKRDSPKSNEKPVYESSKQGLKCTTEDYNIKGRVKRLCEIFQRAHDNSSYRVRLQKVIFKNKASKTPVSGRSSATPSAALKDKCVVSSSKDSTPKAAATVLKSHRGSKSESPAGEHAKAGLGRDPASTLHLEPNTGARTSRSDSNVTSRYKPGNSTKDTVPVDRKLDSIDAASESTLASSLGTDDVSCNMVNRQISESDLAEKEASGSTDSSIDDREALINDILDRFMKDPEFCVTFFTRLGDLKLHNQANAIQFSKIIDELQFLVENDNDAEAVTNTDTEENKKEFDWFYNQPKVFDFKDGDGSDPVGHDTPVADQVETNTKESEVEAEDEKPSEEPENEPLDAEVIGTADAGASFSKDYLNGLDHPSNPYFYDHSPADLTSLEAVADEDDSNQALADQFDWFKREDDL